MGDQSGSDSGTGRWHWRIRQSFKWCKG